MTLRLTADQILTAHTHAKRIHDLYEALERKRFPPMVVSGSVSVDVNESAVRAAIHAEIALNARDLAKMGIDLVDVFGRSCAPETVAARRAPEVK